MKELKLELMSTENELENYFIFIIKNNELKRQINKLTTDIDMLKLCVKLHL